MARIQTDVNQPAYAFDFPWMEFLFCIIFVIGLLIIGLFLVKKGKAGKSV